jgi:Domain of unknown function (DUF6265)
MDRHLVAAACVVAALGAASAHAQEKMTERTFKLAKGGKQPAATIADMAWLAGHWTGQALGGTSEEMWSPPAHGTMMGMYRLLKDGKPVFYELLTLVEENGSLVLRLKHFHANLAGWEEKDQSLAFPLVAKEPGAMHFDGMSFHPQGRDGLTVHLAIGQKDGKVREETFTYKRVEPPAR